MTEPYKPDAFAALNSRDHICDVTKRILAHKGGKKTNFRREGVENLSSPFDFNLFLNQEDKFVNR